MARDETQIANATKSVCKSKHTGDITEHALSLQQAGKFEEAKNQYKKILKRNPKDADALHFIGVLAFKLESNLPH